MREMVEEERGGGGIERWWGCVRNRSQDGRRCRIECAVDGEEEWGGGMVGWTRGCSVRKSCGGVAHKYSRRRRRRLQRRCEGVEKAAAFEGEGGGVGGGGGCVRNRSKDGRRCRIECAVDGEEEWGGGMVGWTRGCSVRKSCGGVAHKYSRRRRRRLQRRCEGADGAVELEVGLDGGGEGGGLRKSEQAFNGRKGLHQACCRRGCEASLISHCYFMNLSVVLFVSGVCSLAAVVCVCSRASGA